MSTLTAAQRKKLKPSQFAGPNGSYPIPDPSHAANAKARAKQALLAGRISKAQYSRIVAKANAVLKRSGSSPAKKADPPDPKSTGNPKFGSQAWDEKYGIKKFKKGEHAKPKAPTPEAAKAAAEENSEKHAELTGRAKKPKFGSPEWDAMYGIKRFKKGEH
jgi:hypothetical protein